MQQSELKLGTGSRKTILEISFRSRLMLTDPVSNRGTTFTDTEREQLSLAGLLTNRVSNIGERLQHTRNQFDRCPSLLSKFVYLSRLRDRNETLCYRLVSEHLEETLPIAYAPAIGKAVERFGHEYVGTRGVFLLIDHPEHIEESLRNFELTPENADLMVVTNSEGIFGTGDQGIDDIQIVIGKLGLYMAATGIHPQRAVPVVLDVGTGSLELLYNDRYLGRRHIRAHDGQYDEFIDRFVRVVTELFPNAVTHWEGFSVTNAHRILQRYAKEICTFSDDIQGTVAVVLAAVIAAVRRAGIPLRRHRFMIYGAETAGIGVADMIQGVLSAASRDPGQLYVFSRNGLIIEDSPGTREFQGPYTRPRSEIDGWDVVDPHRVNLLETIRNAQPIILIGASTRSGAFSEEVMQEVRSHCKRPVIIPLSNPTDRYKVHPSDLLDWTDGRALVTTGSPFEPMRRGSVHHTIAQANNTFIFPGLRLSMSVVQAKLVSKEMIYAATQTLVGLVNEHQPGTSSLPTMRDLRMIAAAVAKAVTETIESQGLARRPLTNPIQDVYERMWKPEYPELRVV